MGFLDYTVFLAVLWRVTLIARQVMAFRAVARPSTGGTRSLHNSSSNVPGPPSGDLQGAARFVSRNAPAAGWPAHHWDRDPAPCENSARRLENRRVSIAHSLH